MSKDNAIEAIRVKFDLGHLQPGYIYRIVRETDMTARKSKNSHKMHV